MKWPASLNPTNAKHGNRCRLDAANDCVKSPLDAKGVSMIALATFVHCWWFPKARHPNTPPLKIGCHGQPYGTNDRALSRDHLLSTPDIPPSSHPRT